jgi:hypothetical protein
MGALLAALFFIGMGLLMLFKKDVMWELTVWQNQRKGVASERTDAWEFEMTLGGIAAVFLGGFVLFIVLFT